MKAGRKKTFLVGCGIALVVAIVAWSLPRKFHAPALPTPNGYDDFLAAAASLRGPQIEYKDEQVIEHLVSTNSAAYELVRTGLAKQCRVKVEADRAYPETHLQELARLKRLTHVLIARAKVEEAKGRSPEAVDAYCEAYLYASRIGQGGLAADFLVQTACEVLVLGHLDPLIPDLTPAQCSDMMTLMGQVEREREMWRSVLSRQQRWDRAVFSVPERTRHFWSRLAEALKARSWFPMRGLHDQLEDAAILRERALQRMLRGLPWSSTPG